MKESSVFARLLKHLPKNVDRQKAVQHSRLVFILFAFSLATSFSMSCGESESSTPSIPDGGAVIGTPVKSAPKPGSQAPNFQSLTTDGEAIALSSFRGKPVILNFWATWCTPCKKEMPDLQGVYDDLSSENIAILAVNFGERPQSVETFADDLSLTFPVVLDADKKISKIYGIYGLPTTFFIDKEGIIRYIKIGPFLTKQEILARLHEKVED